MLIDKIALLSSDKQLFTFDFEGEEKLRAAASKGQGGLLVGTHMGNWEIAGQLLNRIDVPVNIVLVDADNENIKKTIEKAQTKKNIRVIKIKEDFSHLIKIKEAFARNEFVVMHGDRFVAESTTVSVSFMNHEAKFPVGPMYLAMSNQVPLLFVFTLKESKTHYHFFAKGGNIYKNVNNRNEKRKVMKDMVLEYVAELEKTVNKYPLQWFNYYDFWEKEK